MSNLSSKSATAETKRKLRVIFHKIGNSQGVCLRFGSKLGARGNWGRARISLFLPLRFFSARLFSSPYFAFSVPRVIARCLPPPDLCASYPRGSRKCYNFPKNNDPEGWSRISFPPNCEMPRHPRDKPLFGKKQNVQGNWSSVVFKFVFFFDFVEYTP